MRITLAALLLSVLSGCSAPENASPVRPALATDAVPAGVPVRVAAAPAPVRLSPEEVVRAPEARLASAYVTRTGTGLRVAAWWELNVDGSRLRRAIVVREPDGTSSYERWSRRRWSDLAPVEPVAARIPAGLEGLLVGEVVSLRPHVSALMGGGDGATLFPFQKVARSVDGESIWTSYDVPEVGGERGFVNGAVVLPDGRLLVLVMGWSGDRRSRPSSQHHGLWMSAGGDWASYRPIEPVFTPALGSPSGGYLAAWSSLEALWASPARGGVIWVQSSDDRLYVSVDGTESFAEVAAR